MGFLDSYKISSAEQAAAKVQSAPDTLSGSAQDNKKVFDNLPTLIVDKLNAVIEKLGSDQNTNKILMKSTNYSITDGDLKALYGETATLRSILYSMGKKVLYESETGKAPGGTWNIDLSEYEYIEIEVGTDAGTSYSAMKVKVAPEMRCGFSWTSATNLYSYGFRFLYSGNVLTYSKVNAIQWVGSTPSVYSTSIAVRRITGIK